MKWKLTLMFIAGVAVTVGLLAALPNLNFQPVEAENPKSKWSPTKPYPSHKVYYPGTEELKPDEMRVITCGSGMPMPRLKQAAACILIELGNGDKFIFDMGTGSMERLYALGIEALG